jgi:hypothetical protein
MVGSQSLWLLHSLTQAPGHQLSVWRQHSIESGGVALMSGHWHNPEKSSPILRDSEALNDKERHRRGHCKSGGESTYAYHTPYSTHRRAGIAVTHHAMVPLAAQAILHQFNSLAP